jgi:hypothetical protein
MEATHVEPTSLIPVDEDIVLSCPNCKQRFLPCPVEVLFPMKLAAALIGCTPKTLPALLLKYKFPRRYIHKTRNRVKHRMVTGAEIKVLRAHFYSEAPAEATPITEVKKRAAQRRATNAAFKLCGRRAMSRT